MVDNVEQIRGMLNFHKDKFYFFQVLLRKKDMPDAVKGSNNSSRTIKAYFIDSMEKFDAQIGEMIMIANALGARVCVNLNRRSWKRLPLETISIITNQMLDGNYKHAYRAATTACGREKSKDRIWIIDVDAEDVERCPKTVEEWTVRLKQLTHDGEITIYGIVPTKTGYHVITSPFAREFFKERFGDLDIHKNNPTNVYIP